MTKVQGAAALALVLGAAVAVRAEDAADAGARAPLELYLKGHATGDGDYFRRAFHPDAKIQGNREGKLISRTREEFAAARPGSPRRTRRCASAAS